MAADSKDAEQDQELKELLKVYGPVEADVIKSFLESQGIPCILRGRMVQSVMPYTVDGLAEIRVLVADKDFEAAALLLDNAKKFQEDEEEP
ncbi:MAG: DUF2007 domain-containing protein [Candidatus Aminicenantes bacterium]|nr:DUF2007 domain-containing protein [Candidatus Aminicenantes bacterium]